MHTSNKATKESKMEQALKSAAEAYKTKVLNEIKAVRQLETDWKPGYGMIAEDAFLVGAYWLLENAANLTAVSQSSEKGTLASKEWEMAMSSWNVNKPEDKNE
jgi:hypothetical protein